MMFSRMLLRVCDGAEFTLPSWVCEWCGIRIPSRVSNVVQFRIPSRVCDGVEFRVLPRVWEWYGIQFPNFIEMYRFSVLEVDGCKFG